MFGIPAVVQVPHTENPALERQIVFLL